jgi:predicted MFS family arabinose efflux permease
VSYLDFLRSNRRFLSFGFLLLFFSSLGQTYCVSAFGGRIRADFGISHGDFGLYYMLATLASGAALLRFGRTIDRVDLRAYTALVCAGAVASCFLMSFAAGPAFLVLALFCLRFSGQGLMSHTAMTSMGRYFDVGRAKAIGIAALGFSAGFAVFPSLVVWMLQHVHWRAAWQWLGLGAGAVVIPLALWLLRGHGERHAAWLARTTRQDLDEAHAAAAAAETAGSPRQWTRGEMLRDPRFYLLLPGLLAPPCLMTGFIFHHAHLADAKGWSEAWLAGCLVALAIASAVMSMVAGPLTDRWTARRAARVYLVPLGLAMLTLALLRAPAGAAVYLALAGVTAGAAAPVSGSLWADLYGVVHLGSIRAVTSAAMVGSTALGSWVVGVMIDAGLSMEAIAWIALAYVALGVGLIGLATRRAG